MMVRYMNEMGASIIKNILKKLEHHLYKYRIEFIQIGSRDDIKKNKMSRDFTRRLP